MQILDSVIPHWQWYDEKRCRMDDQPRYLKVMNCTYFERCSFPAVYEAKPTTRIAHLQPLTVHSPLLAVSLLAMGTGDLLRATRGRMRNLCQRFLPETGMPFTSSVNLSFETDWPHATIDNDRFASVVKDELNCNVAGYTPLKGGTSSTLR